MNAKILDDLASKIADAIPPGLRSLQSEFEKNVRAILQAAFSKMNLVTREEFDVQSQVLAKTREKLTTLEQTVAKLEQQLGTTTRSGNNPEHLP